MDNMEFILTDISLVSTSIVEGNVDIFTTIHEPLQNLSIDFGGIQGPPGNVLNMSLGDVPSLPNSIDRWVLTCVNGIFSWQRYEIVAEVNSIETENAAFAAGYRFVIRTDLLNSTTTTTTAGPTSSTTTTSSVNPTPYSSIVMSILDTTTTTASNTVPYSTITMVIL
jgi:hypothetical protein